MNHWGFFGKLATSLLIEFSFPRNSWRVSLTNPTAPWMLVSLCAWCFSWTEKINFLIHSRQRTSRFSVRLKWLFRESRSSKSPIPVSRSLQQSRISLPSYSKFPDPSLKKAQSQVMRNLLGTLLYTLKENNTIVKLFKIRSESGLGILQIFPTQCSLWKFLYHTQCQFLAFVYLSWIPMCHKNKLHWKLT